MTVGAIYPMKSNPSFLARVEAIRNGHAEYALIDTSYGYELVVGRTRLHVEDFKLKFEAQEVTK